MEQATLQSLRQQYLDLLTHGANLTQLCELTAQYTDTPVAITLTTRTIIAKSSGYTQELISEYEENLDLCSEEEIQQLNEQVISQLHSGRPVVGLYPYLKHKRINCGCFRGAAMLAVLDCPIVKKMLICDAIEVLSVAAPIFLTALQLNSYVSATISTPMQTYLAGLLNGDSEDWHQQHNLYRSPLEQVSSWIVAWSPALDEKAAESRKKALDLRCSRSDSFCYVPHQDGVALLFDAGQYGTPEILTQLSEECQILCISESFSDIKRTADYLHEAQMTLQLAQYEGNVKPLLTVQTYKKPLLFLSLRDKWSADELRSPLLESIKKYDTDHASEYYETLRAYVLCGMDHAQMAKRLHVHKNTVVYRLQRIADLFAPDLKDCRVLTDLYLSLFADFQP